MCGIVLPIVADVVDVNRSIDVDVIVAPVDVTTPIISSGCPTAEGVARTEGKPSPDDGSRDVAGISEVVRRIRGIRPPTVNNFWIVIWHVDSVGIRRLDDDDLFVLLLFDRNLLLFGGGQFVICLRL
jgi:hypothetical protein